MRWFKMYSEVLNDRKIQSLPGELLRAWLNVLCIANENPRRGYLPPLEDVAFALRVPDDEAERLLDGLLQRGLLDRDKDGWTRPHNWDGRQAREEKSTERVRRHRQKIRAEKAASQPPKTDPGPPKPDGAGVKRDETCFTVPVTEHGNGNGTVLDKTKTSVRREREEEESPTHVVLSPFEHDEDGDDDCDDEAYKEAARRAGYLVVCRGHRDTIEHTRGLFGDKYAELVGNRGLNIKQRLHGHWECFRAAVDYMKRSGKARGGFYSYAIATAVNIHETGMPPDDIPVTADPQAIHPRVFQPAAAPVVPAFLAKREKTSADMRAYKPKPPLDATP